MSVFEILCDFYVNVVTVIRWIMVASAHDGIICLSGLDNGEVVKFYATDGKYLGSSVAANGAASYAVNESLVIAKVGKDSMKIAVK